MTRFARARGSKASNQREPEAATPWSQMVSGLASKETEDVEDLDGDATHLATDVTPEMDVEDTLLSTASEDDHVEETASGSILTEETNAEKPKKKRKRKKDKCLNCKEKGHMKMDCPALSEERRTELRELVTMKIERKGKGTGRKKSKNKRETKEDGSRVEARVGGKREKRDKAGQIVSEGEGLFQGFRVKKEDVKRLQELRQNLISKKVSQEELQEILKRERRRAEKELARSKKMVCYQCRKPGHFLSECPTVTSLSNSTIQKNAGHCFTCGSQEHTSKECKVGGHKKGEEKFQFAMCFICKEIGHLAKTCPDNPRGLYPRGGGCRFCGSVEHLKSDCPRKIEKDAREDFTVDRLNDKTMEVEEEKRTLKRNRAVTAISVAKKPKIVSF